MKRKTKSKTYSTINATAGAIGVPVALLRQAKKRGAHGFSVNGNVCLEKLTAWLLTKGRDFEPQMSLEGARAKLADARARRLEREAAQQGGLVSPLWVAARVEEAFANFDAWFRGDDRAVRIATQVTGGPLDYGTTDNTYVLKNLRIALDTDNQSIRAGMRSVRDQIAMALAAGPEGTEQNAAGELRDYLRTLLKQLSPAAAQELLVALEAEPKK